MSNIINKRELEKKLRNMNVDKKRKIKEAEFVKDIIEIAKKELKDYLKEWKKNQERKFQ